MDIIYTIHNNLDYCYAEFLAKKNSFYDLKESLKQRGKKHIKENKNKKTWQNWLSLKIILKSIKCFRLFTLKELIRS